MRRATKALTSVSIGFLFVGLWLWIYFNASYFAPQNPEAMEQFATKFIIALALIFSLDSYSRVRTEQGLFNLSIVRGGPKYLASIFITIITLRVLLSLIGGVSFLDMLSMFSAGFFSVIVLTAGIVGIGEELIFRGFVVNELKSYGFGIVVVAIISSIAFGFYHFLVDKGNIASMMFHSALGLIFFYIRTKGIPIFRSFPVIGQKWFGPSPQSQLTNAGVHSGYNLFILGLGR